MPDKPEIDLEWIDQDKSPFHVRCLDVRPFTRTMISMTPDPRVALRYNELRMSSGEEHRNQSPPNAMHIDCDLEYPIDDIPSDGPVYLAQEMEDKWDIFLHDDVLYFARSWTSDLGYKAWISFFPPTATIHLIEADAEYCKADQLLAMAQLDFLMKSHIYNLEAPHPLPRDFPEDAKLIAVYSFRRYGRKASFATYENTIDINP